MGVDMDLSNTKLIISEIDGIITDGFSGIGEMDITMFKHFYIKDFEAINMMKRHWDFVFLSSAAAINLSLCRKRNIPFYFAERNKKEIYTKILQRYGVLADDVLYVGATYSDVPCMKESGFSACPEDATVPVKNTADLVMPLMSGTGVLCYIYDFLNDNCLRGL
jgi:3-deoxy-D-manno-octulosonate 8-phosphate phosphatase (KDO 8-P phosphatase)